MLTSKQRAQLRGLAATEDTIVHIGKGGITENIITQMSDALKACLLYTSPSPRDA